MTDSISNEQIDALAEAHDMDKTWYENNPQKHWRDFARAVLELAPKIPPEIARIAANLHAQDNRALAAPGVAAAGLVATSSVEVGLMRGDALFAQKALRIALAETTKARHGMYQTALDAITAIVDSLQAAPLYDGVTTHPEFGGGGVEGPKNG